MPTELPTLHCAAAEDWERWLETNHAASPGVWLRFAKRGAGEPSVGFPQALELAICFGWIDGQLRPLDSGFYLRRFTPRGPRSRWSQVNRSKAEDLIAAGRMRAPGLAQVQAAQADGRWEAAYEPQSRATVPDDLQRALAAEPAAGEFFETLTGVRRYAFLYRLHHVKDPQARARRIAGYIELLREGRTLN
ncbi:MAG TPA: YdeI/OmpD-associated family protein [Solirubrobacteraceae bacterium]|nr:YdeI/OmpD-associated family protein [Solirubrobacteraceae bacterium]